MEQNATTRTSARGTVEVEMCPDSEPRFAAIVLLLGEDDVTTADLVGETIDRVEGSVLVDLSECSFIDSTTIGKLIATAQTLERRG